MKKTSVLFAILMIAMVSLFAQAPQKFSYQAVLRDAGNNLVTSQAVGIRISILQGSVNGSVAYMETQTAVTNANGLVTLQIGGGNVLSGDMSAIDWANGPFFLKTEADPTGGANYTIEGTQQLLSVPYALYAGNSISGFSGDYNDLINTPDIPTVPTNVGAFANDAGYITMAQVPAQVNADWNATSGAAEIYNKPALFSGNYNDLTNKPTLFDGNYYSLSNRPNLAMVATTGNYNDLTNRPQIPTVPTNVSAFANDAGYITADSLANLHNQLNEIQQTLDSLQQIIEEDHFTCGTSTVTDIDGNVYNTVRIGEQCWMKENLRTTHYADGIAIEAGSSTSTTTPYRYSPNNNESNVSIYGYLYNWSAVMYGASSSGTNPSGVQGICPNGWHVPSDAEWSQLTNYMSRQDEYVCGNDYINIAKALAATTGWNSYSTACAVGNIPSNNNATGFSALPAGYLFNYGYNGFGYYTYFWSAMEASSTNADAWKLDYSYAYAGHSNYSKSDGYSVRCVCDNRSVGEYLQGVSEQVAAQQSVIDSLAPIAFSGDYNDLSNIPEIPTAQVNSDWNATTGVAQILNKPVLFSGDYNDLSNKPTIPTVPYNVSVFYNDAHYITEAQLNALLSGMNNTIDSLRNRINELETAPSIQEPEFASVSTVSALYVTETTAQCGGNVTSDGGSPVNARGVCWSTSHNPTINDNHTSDGSGKGSFVSILSGLNSGTTYYVRAYAVNGEGAFYGNEESFTTPTPFTCGTSTVTDFDGNTYNTVKIGEQCWMKENLRTTHYATGAAILQSSITNMSSSEFYYYNVGSAQSYGYLYNWPAVIGPANVSTNNQGICPSGWHVPGDGEWMQLISYVSSKSQYYCSSNSIYIAKALASSLGWKSTSGNCTVGYAPSSNNATGFSALPAGYINNSSYTSSSEEARFWSATEQNNSYAYYIRLFYDNTVVSSGTESKSNGLSVRCLRDEGVSTSLPTLTTDGVTSITATTANSGGYISSGGNTTVTARGVCWSTSHSPTVNNSHTDDGMGTGSFTSNLTGLTPGTTYYVRAYAINGVGISYGNEVSFTTPIPALPTLTTNAVSSITTTTASAGGNVTNDGGISVISRGVCWSTSHNPTINNSHTVDGTGTGDFTSNLTGLSSGTTYYVRAYAVNEIGIAYGGEVNFTTLIPTLSTLTTNAVTSVTTTTAISGGNISSDGGSSITSRGVCWSTSHNPTINNSHTIDGVGTGEFTSNLTGLSSGTTYYVRAYAVSSAGVSYGNELTFTTISPFVCGTSTVTDYDGNIYNTVQIGSQCWMKENVRATHYSNGTAITQGSVSQSSYTTRYYYNPGNATAYGYLYNWSAAKGPSSVSANNQGICPIGWHVPSSGELTQLEQYVGSQSQYLCGNSSYAKALAATTGWISGSSVNTCAVGNTSTNNNATGFGALPAGWFCDDSYLGSGLYAYFWSATEYDDYDAYIHYLSYNSDYVHINSYHKNYGCSVRCVRD